MSVRARLISFLIVALTASCVAAQELVRKRALLIGIDDYTAAGLRPPEGLRRMVPGREWPDLGGSVNDVEAMRELLILLYDFKVGDIVTLTNQSATRERILAAIDTHLVQPAARGDVVVFYFAGHGAQVRNSRSDEDDKLDEAIVPADSQLGALDIRDKELRRIFNRVIDKRARLTVILDSCNSGSGVRGLPTGAQPMGVKRDDRDVADAPSGPRLEDRGALILTAAPDNGSAWLTRDRQKNLHGVFSWALERAMRDAGAGEPAIDTFLRAQARLRGETPFQEPVIAGDEDARMTPFLGAPGDRRTPRTVVAVERVESAETLILQGGWANGLTEGSELRALGKDGRTVRVEITEMMGLGRSRAQTSASSRARADALEPGALLEVVGWAAPSGKPLRVWMPDIELPATALAEIARDLAGAASKRRIKWICDPTDVTPTHVIRWREHAWELLGPDGNVRRFGDAREALAGVPARTSLFVQLPVPSTLDRRIAVGPGTDREAVEPAARPEDADYILTGRYASQRIEYAWVRPFVTKQDERRTPMPLHTNWVPVDARSVAYDLIDAVLRLRKVHAWHVLESPMANYSYSLGLRCAGEREAVNGKINGRDKFGIFLRPRKVTVAETSPRYVYAFMIDSWGKSVLLYPRNGSVENQFPPAARASQAEIPLTADSLFEIVPPYGVDTYVLLSTDEALPNPWILQWDGVLTRFPEVRTPLEELLASTSGPTRSHGIRTPWNWSIERVVVESVPPRALPPKKRSRR